MSVCLKVREWAHHQSLTEMTVLAPGSDHKGKHSAQLSSAQHSGMTSQCKVRKSRMGMQAQTCPAASVAEALG